MTDMTARYLPWIPVTSPAGSELVGVEELLRRAHELDDLAVDGLERAALLRFLPQVLALVGRGFVSSAAEFAAMKALPADAVVSALDAIDSHLELAHPVTPFLQDSRIRQVLAVKPTAPKPPRELSWAVPGATSKGWFGREEQDTDVSLSAADACLALTVEWFYGKSGNDRIDGFYNTAGTVGLFGAENQFFFRGQNLLRTLLANLPERWLLDGTLPTWVSRSVGSQPPRTLAEASTTCGAVLLDFDHARAVGMYRLGALPPLDDYLVWKSRADLTGQLADRGLEKKALTALAKKLTELVKAQDDAAALVEKNDGVAAARAFNKTLTARTGPESLRPDSAKDQKLVDAARIAKANLAGLYASSKELRAATIGNARKNDHHRVFTRPPKPKQEPRSVFAIRPGASQHQNLIRWFASTDIPKDIHPDSVLVAAGDADDVTVSVLCIDATRGKAPTLEGISWLHIPDSRLLFEVDELRGEVLTALASDITARVTDKVKLLTGMLWPGDHNTAIRTRFQERILHRFYAAADARISELVTRVYTADLAGEDTTALTASIRPTWYRLRDTAAVTELDPLMTGSFTEKAIVALARAGMSGPDHNPARALPPTLSSLTEKVTAGRMDPAFRVFVASELTPRLTAASAAAAGAVPDVWREVRRAPLPVRRAFALAAAHPRLPLDEDRPLGEALASVSRGDDAVAQRVRGLVTVDDIDQVTTILNTLLSRLDSHRRGLNWFDVTDLLLRWNSADRDRVRRQLLFDFYLHAAV